MAGKQHLLGTSAHSAELHRSSHFSAGKLSKPERTCLHDSGHRTVEQSTLEGTLEGHLLQPLDKKAEQVRLPTTLSSRILKTSTGMDSYCVPEEAVSGNGCKNFLSYVEMKPLPVQFFSVAR